MALSGAAFGAVLGQQAAEAGVPAALLRSTIESAASFAAGEAAAAIVSARVTSLTESVLKLMLLTKLKIGAAVLLGLAVAGVGLMTFAPAQTQSTEPGGKPAPGDIQRLIDQFSSPKFAEREAAAGELRRIGEPALGPLREAAKGKRELEVRRRAERVAREIMDDTIARLLKEETREDEEHNRKVVRILDRVTELGKERLGAGRAAAPENVPVLADAYLRLARARKMLGQSRAAAEAYLQSEHFCLDERKHRGVRREFVPVLMPVWEQAVREQMARDPELKKMAAKYPLIVLHSRRYADGDYLQSAYSFIYETADERKHYNDVQILFDNGTGKRTFCVNMVTNQRNRVYDLGKVDFTIDPSPPKDVPEQPDDERHQALSGHVYLELVRDTNGNHFFVLFQAVAVDEQSRYMAFVWRRLPGGKTVRRN